MNFGSWSWSRINSFHLTQGSERDQVRTSYILSNNIRY